MLHPGKKLVGGSASRARGVLFGLLTVFIPGVTLVVILVLLFGRLRPGWMAS